MTNVHLVTGATGFVGGALVLELLARTDSQVACLVREDPASSPHERLETSLTHAARIYGRADLEHEIKSRCKAVPGDIVAPFCGAAAMRLAKGAKIWHCAASLKFREEQESEIFTHNVEGTRNILKLARHLKSSCLNYISTAYVAGARTGVVREELPAPDLAAHNSYERSKIHAEIVLSQFTAVHTRILRPSIVIGHSRTHAATRFTGLYGFIGDLRRLKTRFLRRSRGLSHSNSSIRILGQPGTPLNLIPVDAVAADAVRVGLSNSPARIFHLTNSEQPEAACVAAIVMEELGLPPARFVESIGNFTVIDQAVGRALLFYGSYLKSPKIFDRTNTDACGGNSRWPLDGGTIRSYVRWFLETGVPAQKPPLRAAV